MLFSIYLLLVPAKFIRRSHLPMAHKSLQNQRTMQFVACAHMLSKILPSTEKGE